MHGGLAILFIKKQFPSPMPGIHRKYGFDLYPGPRASFYIKLMCILRFAEDNDMIWDGLSRFARNLKCLVLLEFFVIQRKHELVCLWSVALISGVACSWATDL